MDRKRQIELFFQGKLDQAEAERLFEWINSEEGRIYFENEIDASWTQQQSDSQFSEHDRSKLWNKLLADQGISAGERKNQKTNKGKITKLWYWAAASVILLMGFTWAYINFVESYRLHESEMAVDIEWVNRENPPGKKTKIHLPDGSVVYLNAASRISYPIDFPANRSVKLEGEAFFEVVRNEDYPFQVESKGITTEVLGTSFNICTFSPKSEVQVTLVSGKVKLGKIGSAEEFFLEPGEESMASMAGDSFTKNTVDVSKRISWISGVLEFEDTPFDQMTAMLERWYGVKIHLKGEPPSVLSSGTFQNNETLANVLNVLGSSIGFDYEIKEKEVVITFK